MSAYKVTDLAPLESRAASGEGRVRDTAAGGSDHPPGADSSVRAYLNVSAAGGTTPTLDVEIVAPINGTDHIVGFFAQATGVTRETITIPDCPRDLKAVWTVGGGTPDFTFEVVTTRW